LGRQETLVGSDFLLDSRFGGLQRPKSFFAKSAPLSARSGMPAPVGESRPVSDRKSAETAKFGSAIRYDSIRFDIFQKTGQFASASTTVGRIGEIA
jgi:hypothetical protein